MEHILLVEDNLPDAELIRSYLNEAPFAYRLYHTHSLQEGLAIVRHNPINIALLDLGLNDSTGLATLNLFFEEVPNVPVIVLTGNTNDIVGMSAIRAGAQRVLIKGDFSARQLIRGIRHAILQFKRQADLYQEVWEMRRRQKHDQQLLQWVQVGSWHMDLPDNTMHWCDEIYEMLGFQPGSFEPVLADYLRLTYSEDRDQVAAFFDGVNRTGRAATIIHRAIVRNRFLKYFQLRARISAETLDGRILLLGALQDVTELYHYAKDWRPVQTNGAPVVASEASKLPLMDSALYLPEASDVHLLPKNGASPGKYAFKALIIEPQSIVQISLRRMLKLMCDNIQLDYADTLEEGEKKLQTADFDLILLNVQLSTIDNPALQNILQNPQVVPVIALSSDSSPQLRQTLLTKGAKECIAHPPRREELQHAIWQALRY